MSRTVARLRVRREGHLEEREYVLVQGDVVTVEVGSAPDGISVTIDHLFPEEEPPLRLGPPRTAIGYGPDQDLGTGGAW